MHNKPISCNNNNIVTVCRGKNIQLFLDLIAPIFSERSRIEEKFMRFACDEH